MSATRRSALGLSLILSLGLACSGAGDSAPAKVDPVKTPANDKPAEGAASAGEAAPAGDAPAATAGAARAGEVAASAGEAGASAGEAGASAGEAGASAGEAAASAGEAGASAGAAAADPAAAKEAVGKLLDEAKSKKTKDERARKALEEAEAAGAEASELAKAAFARAEALGDAERSTPFYEWARDKDPKYAEPSFAMAKGTALAGDIEGTLAHLEEVKKRGGRKLLKTVGYDPIFEAVKDDPKIQALIK